MLKILMVTLVIFSFSLFANQDMDQVEQINKCDKIYDNCALKCEKNEATDNEECYAKCEALFDKCQNESEDLEEKQN